MKLPVNLKRLILSLVVVLGGVGISHGIVNAQSTKSQQSLAAIISNGTSAINHRLTTLNTFTSQINSSKKLSASDKTSLASEVSSEITGLTALKTTLAADTTTTKASSDVASIYSVYRVYALVGPKIGLVTEADGQLTNEAALTTTSQSLQTEITAKQTAGKDVSSIQTMLTNMNTQVTGAQTISSGVHDKVLPLLPSDWNANQQLFSGDASQLATASKDIVAANADAKAINVSLKALK